MAVKGCSSCFLSFFLSLTLPHFSSVFPPENLEPHMAPLEIGHPEVGRYFSEFAEIHYVANEELQTRYPEDMAQTLGTVQELYHRLTSDPGSQDEAPATDQNSH